jgi:hypothetical protein
MHSVENLYEELSFAALGVAGDKVAGLKRDISFVCYLDEESHIKLRDCIPVIAGIAIFIALAACYAATALENRRLINENNSLTAKIAAIEASEEYQRKASMQEDLILLTAYNENCEVCIQTLEATKRFSSEEFITVDELAPAGIKITGHEMDENRIRFYCMAGDANGPAEFAQIVAQTDIFENVEYTGFTAYSDMDGTIGYSFLLECSRKEELP